MRLTHLEQPFSIRLVVSLTPPWITPNNITWLRLACIPLMWLALLAHPLLAFTVYTLGCVSDWWDGVLARGRNEDSAEGKRLDELVDKAFVLGAFVMLVYAGVAPLGQQVFFTFALITLRDLFVTGLRWRYPEEAALIPSLFWAKAKTMLLMVSFGFLMLGVSFPVCVLVGSALIGLALVAALFSGVQYGYLFWRLRK